METATLAYIFMALAIINLIIAIVKLVLTRKLESMVLTLSESEVKELMPTLSEKSQERVKEILAK